MNFGTFAKASRSLRAWTTDARAGDRGTLPVQLNLPITDNCNARCVMCDVWKTQSTGEMDAEALRRVLTDRLFHHIEHVGISGGEPSLRGDLPELVEATVEALPRLATLSITTHGFHHDRWRRFLTGIQRSCASRGVRLTLNLSVDGVGSVHDRVRGIPGAFDRTMRTHRIARELGVPVAWQTTVSSSNVFAVGAVLRRAGQEHVPILFRQATEIARLDNAASVQAVTLDPNARSFFADFLQSGAVSNATGSPARRLFNRDLARRLVDSSARRAPCHFQRQGVLLSPHGELFQCSISTESLGNAIAASAYDLYFSPRSVRLRSRLICETCPGCVHDQAGAWSPVALAVETAATTRFGRAARTARRGANIAVRGIAALSTAKLTRRHRPGTQRGAGTKTALVIGAYGGEHVGDAAILGGVLLRLQREHGITHAHVASTRVDRTTRWVSCLDVPVGIDVFPYEPAEFRARLAAVDLVAYGGGPLMDLPELLIRHLESAIDAARLGVPFVFEGVGYGPFRTLASRAFAHALIDRAAGATVRSERAAAVFRARGIESRVDRDPAFDYLETRRVLDRISGRENHSLETLLQGTASGTRIGLNLRPFWHKYGGGDVKQREVHFIDQFAQALVAVGDRATSPVSFIFFPMNADQYGFSDLTAAYKLREAIDGRIDFRIWELEPGIDAVLALLRRLDAAITMRFHATIFALSQCVSTVGIDYQFDAVGKVGELLRSHGGGAVLRVDDFEPDVLLEQVLTILSNRPADSAANTRRS